MEKINIAELLKDCPQGMELDCTMFDNVTFERVAHNGIWINYLNDKNYKYEIYLNNEGCLPVSSLNLKTTKCVIFPKGKTTWEGFVPPYQFKDGDIVTSPLGNIAIISNTIDNKLYNTYCGFYEHKNLITNNIKVYVERLATEEEKQKLFDAIKVNGYKWNSNNKTLEKLIKPIFKVGDRIRRKNNPTIIKIIGHISSDSYALYDGRLLYFKEQDEWELVPNKFDISKLQPFDKVLVRNTNNEKWCGKFYMYYNKNEDYPFECTYNCWKYCIPYKGNEYLLRKTDDCNEYYKTWE